jgi:molecular chaperone DnaK
MISENTTIPTSKTQIFSTAADNQTSVDINIATGGRTMFSDNKFLGTFHLDGILPAKKGEPQIEVEFSIDANSILTVKAKDKATNKENKIIIKGNTSLTPDEIDRMKKEAEENAENDKKEIEKINKLNEADSLIFQTEKQLDEISDKLDETDKTNLAEKVEKLKTAKESKKIADIDNSIKELNDTWNEISTKLYSNNSDTNAESDTYTDNK